MKKKIIIIISAMFILSACTKQTPILENKSENINISTSSSQIKTEPKPEPKQVGVSLADLLKQKVGKGGIGRLKEMGTPEDEVAPPVIKIPQTTKQ